MSAVLAASSLCAGYGGHPVVTDVDLHVDAGEVVALLGANGAGKTTTLLTLAGVLAPISGVVELFGAPTKAPLHRRAKRGLSLVTEDRSLFMGLTVAENLRVAGCERGAAADVFPELGPLMGRTTGLLSGGEQQMLTLARALARAPKLLMADELSLGLAPLIVQRLLQTVRAAADSEGIGVLLVEQHVKQALRFSDRVYVMRRGQIVFQGTVVEARSHLDELSDAYLLGNQRVNGTP